MKTIWALYDDGNMSWYNCGYDKSKYRVISIGIQEHNDLKDYHKIDLRLSNYNLINELSKLPKPDIIVASPPCESWSIADNQQRLFREIVTIQDHNIINFYTEDKIINNNLEMHKNRKRDYYKQFRTMLIGFDTSIATGYIINYFKPKFWIIENPQSSKIWDYLSKTCIYSGYRNIAHYNLYDLNFSKKPTCFLSNIKLNLKAENKKAIINFEKISGYNRRSSIPKELLLDILDQLGGLIKNELNKFNSFNLPLRVKNRR